MHNLIPWLSVVYVLGAVITFLTGSSTHYEVSQLTSLVDTTQRVMSALIWPFYWPIRLSWVATHGSLSAV
ncbi:MAG: hypothetical protein SOR95_02005 [Sutterella sp.]|nr:hypothetical protein [Sutterella sp.]